MFKQADKRGSEVEAVTAGCRAEQRLMGRVLERSQRPPSAESHGNRNAFVYCCCLTVCHAQGQKEYSAMAAQTDYCLLRRGRNFIPRLHSAALLFYDSFTTLKRSTFDLRFAMLSWPITKMPFRSGRRAIFITHKNCCINYIVFFLLWLVT